MKKYSTRTIALYMLGLTIFTITAAAKDGSDNGGVSFPDPGNHVDELWDPKTGQGRSFVYQQLVYTTQGQGGLSDHVHQWGDGYVL